MTKTFTAIVTSAAILVATLPAAAETARLTGASTQGTSISTTPASERDGDVRGISGTDLGSGRISNGDLGSGR